KQTNVDSLEHMFASGREAGVRLVAWQMSMDVMGITAEELMDGVEIGGVATYMEHASNSNVNLFV
ncbi:MAG: DsrE/DsrF/DrsH-like family protein, partial [Alkalispirochaeta sp.]